MSVTGAFQESHDYWSVGQLISIQVGENRVVGLLHKVQSQAPYWKPKEHNALTLHVELSGEVRPNGQGSSAFSGGITKYPHLGAVAHRIRHADLRTIYSATDKSVVSVGTLSQNADVTALVSVDTLLARHFAVFGTTGTGKSTAVSLLLHLIADKKPNQRILILDPHDEYANAFGKKAVTLSAESLDLPFWMLTLEELAHVIFRGNPVIEEEVNALRDLIIRAKQQYLEKRPFDMPTETSNSAGLTADLPVPYRLADLMSLIQSDIGSLDRAQQRTTLTQLKWRLESIINDPRYGFLFGSNDVTDRMETILGQIFRIPLERKPITVFQMSGIPSEVVDSIASVLCRFAFEIALASHSRTRTLIVCEEAHRYIPAEASGAFAPTRTAIARIAKEGRKYGVSLAIISQRQNELDSTILSQCNTLFALRLGNESDQRIIRKALSMRSHSSLSFLSSLADRECIAFGSALPLPMRLCFRNVPLAARPRSALITSSQDMNETLAIKSIIATLRGTPKPGRNMKAGRLADKINPSQSPSARVSQAQKVTHATPKSGLELRQQLRTKLLEPDEDLELLDGDM